MSYSVSNIVPIHSVATENSYQRRLEYNQAMRTQMSHDRLKYNGEVASNTTVPIYITDDKYLNPVSYGYEDVPNNNQAGQPLKNKYIRHQNFNVFPKTGNKKARVQ